MVGRRKGSGRERHSCDRCCGCAALDAANSLRVYPYVGSSGRRVIDDGEVRSQRSRSPSGSAGVRIVATRFSSLLDGLLLYSVIGSLWLLVAPVSPRVPWRIVAVCWVALTWYLVYRRHRRAGVFVDANGIRLQGMFSSEGLAWSEVAAVLIDDSRRPAYFGDRRLRFLSVIPTAGSQILRHPLPLLARSVPARFAAFCRVYSIDVPLNPTEPWCDRVGVWHGPLREFDPFESIRSIRRAAVGPYRVSVLVNDHGFKVVTEDELTKTITRQASPFASLNEAIDDATTQIQHLSNAPTDHA
jgi:hypothetical protein